MKKQHEFSNPLVADKFAAYPDSVRPVMYELRQLILNTAAQIEGVGKIEETLKWGEPSYLAKGGSTVRIDWKKKSPDYCGMYFNCQSTLVDTFKELYGDTLTVQGNRAIVIKLNEPIPATELKHCVSLSLTYHKIKHLPLLGA